MRTASCRVCFGTAEVSVRREPGAAVSFTNRMHIGSGGTVYVGDTANADMTQGITIQQGGADNHILALKSTDISHPMTSICQDDTFGYITKHVHDAGGIDMIGLSSQSFGLVFRAIVTSEVTTDTTSSQGAAGMSISKSNGSGSHTNVGSTGNILNISNYDTCRFVMKGDGTVHASDTSWATALDDMPDALAGRAYTTEMARRHGDGLLGGMEIDAPDLVQRMEDAGIVTHAEEEGEGTIPGHRFLNVQKGIKFSWDMGFQNFKWMYEMAKVLSDEQRAALPEDMQRAFAALESNESQFLQEKN